MTTFRLEEDPKVFITPHYYENKYVYRIETIDDKSNRRAIRKIDLRKDRLMIHGTEMKEPMLQKFHDSLVLWPKNGIIDVNCNGACYIYVKGKGTYRPMHEAIYDWSTFGIVVPNSLTESLKKQLASKDDVINQYKDLVSAYEANSESRKASLEASEKMVEELKGQLINSNNDLGAMKRALGLSEKREIEKTKEIVTLGKECEEMEIRLRDFGERISSLEHELQTTLSKLETSTSRVKELESDRLSALDQLSSVRSEFESTQRKLESSNRRIGELEDELSRSRMGMEEKVAELRRVQDELSRFQSKSISRKFGRLFTRPA